MRSRCTKAWQKRWEPYAGRVPLIIQSVCFTADDAVIESLTRPRKCSGWAPMPSAVAIGVRGPNEGRFLKLLADMVEEADRIGLPGNRACLSERFQQRRSDCIRSREHHVGGTLRIECGADVIKVPFTGDAESFREIISTCPVAGGSRGRSALRATPDALEMLAKVVVSGARGATIGRNIWGTPDPTAAVRACRAVIMMR